MTQMKTKIIHLKQAFLKSFSASKKMITSTLKSHTTGTSWLFFPRNPTACLDNVASLHNIKVTKMNKENAPKPQLKTSSSKDYI